MPVLVQFGEGAQRWAGQQALEPQSARHGLGAIQDHRPVRLIVPIEVFAAGEKIGQRLRQSGLSHLSGAGKKGHLPMFPIVASEFVQQCALHDRSPDRRKSVMAILRLQ